MKIIFPFVYGTLSSASFNRLCGYYKGLKYLGVEVTFLVFYKDEINLPSNTPKGIIYIKTPFNSKGLISKIMRFKQMISTINSYLNCGDCIYLYGVPYELVEYYKRNRNIHIVGEITEKLDERTKKPNKIRTLLNKRFEKKINNLDFLFVISTSLQEYYLSKGLPKNKIDVINMFVDYERMEHIKTKQSDKYIACCGSMSSQKDGIDTLIRSFAIFQKKHPDYKLKLIGPFINQEDEDSLRRLIIDLRLEKSVEFTGFIRSDVIPMLLKNATILALARPRTKQSQYGFPTKLGEYLSTEVPIVVSNVGEIGNFLKDLENCRLAEPSNVEDFAEKLSWIADNYEEAKKLAKKGYELVLSDFSYLTQSKKLYNRLLALGMK